MKEKNQFIFYGKPICPQKYGQNWTILSENSHFLLKQESFGNEAWTANRISRFFSLEGAAKESNNKGKRRRRIRNSKMEINNLSTIGYHGTCFYGHVEHFGHFRDFAWSFVNFWDFGNILLAFAVMWQAMLFFEILWKVFGIFLILQNVLRIFTIFWEFDVVCYYFLWWRHLAIVFTMSMPHWYEKMFC